MTIEAGFNDMWDALLLASHRLEMASIAYRPPTQDAARRAIADMLVRYAPMRFRNSSTVEMQEAPFGIVALDAIYGRNPEPRDWVEYPPSDNCMVTYLRSRGLI